MHVFQIDLGFSSRFYRIMRDTAYAVFNSHEWWMALFLSTDTD